MKIAEIKTFRIHPKAIKEAWDNDDYVWPSRPPSFIVRITTDVGEHGVGEATSQVWYLGETAEQIASCLTLYNDVLRGHDPENIAIAHRLMDGCYSGGMPGWRTARSAV
ncbi:MAG: hypothetical protein ABI837_09450, partial [Acidobacteriota bacterium]